MIYYIIIIAVAAALVLSLWLAPGGNGPRKDRSEEKQRNKAKLLVYIKMEKRVTNDMVEKLLGISNNTAERYLDELEKEGIIRQIGKTGRGVYYELIE